VATNVRTQYSLFRWSRILKAWLKCVPILEKGTPLNILSLVRVSVVECVCHDRGEAEEGFFYMYMCHFSQLHMQILFDNFTMGVLWLLNVAPTQLHPNSWGYHQAFHVLCQSLYLRHSPQCFLYSYDTRPKSPITWLSLINHPGISMLDAFSQSFKHFKDGFFKVVVKEASCSHFYNEDRITKFPFSWTDNPWWYKDMKKEELSARDRGVVEILGRFSNKLSTKGLIRAYLSVHPLVDLEGIIVLFLPLCFM